jgi:hypothetical protein
MKKKMTKWNPQVFDKHIDQEFSAFTSAEIPDPESVSSGKYLMADYFLNSTFRGRLTGCWHQMTMGLIWRAQLCLKHYSAARSDTLEYVEDHDPHQPKLGTYFRALAEWEAFLVNAMLAIDYANQCNKQVNGEKAFTKDDGSIGQRVYDMGIHIKHMQDRIAQERVDHSSTMPVILTNDGIKSSSGLLVSYAEAFKLLGELAADAIMLMDPSGIPEARRANKAADKT